MAIIFDLEGIPVPEEPQVPDEGVPDEGDNPNTVLPDAIYEPGSADVSSTAALDAIPDIPIDPERLLSPAVEEAFELIRRIVVNGEIGIEDAADIEALLYTDLSSSERIILLELLDAGIEDRTIPADCHIADNFWELQDLDNCAVVVQKMILDAVGIPNSEAQLTLRALIDGSLGGIFDGMDSLRIGEILERHGIAVHTIPYVTGTELDAQLSAGRGVIAIVDADELWGFDDDAYDGGRGENHAVFVREIDRSDPDNPVVVMNDSGIEDGAERRVPLDIFLDAFEDSGNFAIVTDEPLEQLRQQEAEDAVE